MCVALLSLVGCSEAEEAASQAAGGMPEDAILQGVAHAPAPSAHPERLRIVDWNIAAGRGSSIEAVAARLMALEPDVVALQELDVETRRSGQVDQPARLAGALTFSYAFARTIPWLGGSYGIALLSRHPLMQLRRIPLSNQDAAEPRTALEAVVCAGEDACLRVIDHHADLAPLSAAISVREIVDDLSAALGTGVVFVGDLNQVPTDSGPSYCVAHGLIDTGAGDDHPTQGGRRIDYAFVDDRLARCVMQLRVAEVPESDHDPLVLDLDVACLRAH